MRYDLSERRRNDVDVAKLSISEPQFSRKRRNSGAEIDISATHRHRFDIFSTLHFSPGWAQHLVRDGGDEALDVQLGGAALLAGRVGTLEAPRRLPERRPLAQRRVLDVIKVPFQGPAALQRCHHDVTVV